jgi:hypothetical protein
MTFVPASAMGVGLVEGDSFARDRQMICHLDSEPGMFPSECCDIITGSGTSRRAFLLVLSAAALESSFQCTWRGLQRHQ